MSTHKTEHTSRSEHPKVSNSLLGIIAIFAIFLIVWFAFKDINRNTQAAISGGANNLVGGATDASVAQALAQTQSSDVLNADICKIVVGQTTIYDETTFASSLEVGASAYYAGNTIKIQKINADGCLIDVNGDVEYLAVGQVQRVGTVYVTVKDVVTP